MLRRGFFGGRHAVKEIGMLMGMWATGVTYGTTDFYPNYVADNWTVEAWAYPTMSITLHSESTTGTAAVSGNGLLIGPRNESSNRGGGLSVGSNGMTLLQHGSGNISALARYSGSITGWNHVAGRSSSKVGSLVLNGTTVRTGLTCPTTYFYSPRNYLAWMDYGVYNGYADEIRIWNYAKTDEEIAATMYQRVPVGSPGLIALIRFPNQDGAPYDYVMNRGIPMNKALAHSVTNGCPFLPSYV